jgi:hypothetical protein
VLRGQRAPGRVPDLWDGRAAERIVGILQKTLTVNRPTAVKQASAV